ncbi:hypothetical protein ACFL1W_00455 [Candidatus Margulisiibacteriota bacterium]
MTRQARTPGFYQRAKRFVRGSKQLTAKDHFRNDLRSVTNPYFSWHKALASKPVTIGLTLALASIRIPAITLPLIGIILEKLSVARSSKALKHEPDLLARMIKTSGQLEANTIAKDLLYRGNKDINQKYLAGLKEADGTKFNEVMDLMQNSRLQKVATAKKIARGAAWWLPFAAYEVGFIYYAGQ